MKQLKTDEQFPIPPNIINRILLIVIVILALYSGYFHAKYGSELGRYRRLEKKYFQLEQKYDTVLQNTVTDPE